MTYKLEWREYYIIHLTSYFYFHICLSLKKNQYGEKQKNRAGGTERKTKNRTVATGRNGGADGLSALAPCCVPHGLLLCATQKKNKGNS